MVFFGEIAQNIAETFQRKKPPQNGLETSHPLDHPGVNVTLYH